MYNYSNYALFGMKNDTERYLYAGWLIFVVICSLLGDSIILIASIKYKVFKFHKMIVTFIQHIAVNDLLNTIGSLAPAILSAAYNTGSPYRILDYSRFFIAYQTSSLSAMFISAMALGKVLLLKYPLRVGFLTKRDTHKICVGFWIASISVPVVYLVIDKQNVIFDFRVYHCTYSYSSEIWKYILPISALLVLVIPNIIVIVSSILLLKEATRVVRNTRQSLKGGCITQNTRDGLKWQGITTVGLTAVIYTISFLPYIAYFIAEPFVVKVPGDPGPFYVEYFRVVNGLVTLHVLSNFFVYSLTVASFRSFLLSALRGKDRVISSRAQSTGNDSVQSTGNDSVKSTGNDSVQTSAIFRLN